ncbi:TIR domain-containing protein [Burkholderia sp. D7]|nr:TIR domain-containing protein [Burkholderia sp. D7]
MTDFFISYTKADKVWAEWIGYVLEEKGFKVVIQAWDFRPGNNFVLEMQKAAATADRTLMVLSPDYIQSEFAAPEWASAFGQDPQGRNSKLVPVMVGACNPLGLLAPIVQIRIVGLDEDAARKELLAGVDAKRAKPSARPPFPGAANQVEHKPFPGPHSAVQQAGARPAVSAGLIPALKQNPTDADKRRFAKAGFETIRTTFETNLLSVSQEEPRIEASFEPVTAIDFRAEIFLDGKSKCFCRIWMGGMHSADNICYSEGRYMSGDSCNEILSLSQPGELYFQALMSGFGFDRKFDMKRLSAEDAAEYLWQRFVAPLGY